MMRTLNLNLTLSCWYCSFRFYQWVTEDHHKDHDRDHNYCIASHRTLHNLHILGRSPGVQPGAKQKTSTSKFQLQIFWFDSSWSNKQWVNSWDMRRPWIHEFVLHIDVPTHGHRHCPTLTLTPNVFFIPRASHKSWWHGVMVALWHDLQTSSSNLMLGMATAFMDSDGST